MDPFHLSFSFHLLLRRASNILGGRAKSFVGVSRRAVISSERPPPPPRLIRGHYSNFTLLTPLMLTLWLKILQMWIASFFGAVGFLCFASKRGCRGWHEWNFVHMLQIYHNNTFLKGKKVWMQQLHFISTILQFCWIQNFALENKSPFICLTQPCRSHSKIQNLVYKGL